MSDLVQQSSLGDMKKLAADLVDNLDNFAIEEERYERVSSPDEVWSFLDGLSIEAGWLCFTDRVQSLRKPCTLSKSVGVLLDAELVLSDELSLHLHHDGGAFCLRWLKYVESEHAWGTRREFFAAEGPRPGKGFLLYDIGWSLCPDLAGELVLQPTQARFAGFSES